MSEQLEPKAPEEWAHLEVYGHRSHWGRVSEVTRFGATVLRIDVPTTDPEVFETHFYGGGAIFSLTPCTEESARQWAERSRPRAYQAVALPAPVSDWEDDQEPDSTEGDDDV
jgi:hypothetical protein